MLQEGDKPSPIHHAMHRSVIEAAYDVIQRKGYTNWAVGLTGAYIGKAVLYDQRKIMYVSLFLVCCSSSGCPRVYVCVCIYIYVCV